MNKPAEHVADLEGGNVKRTSRWWLRLPLLVAVFYWAGLLWLLGLWQNALVASALAIASLIVVASARWWPAKEDLVRRYWPHAALLAVALAVVGLIVLLGRAL